MNEREFLNCYDIHHIRVSNKLPCNPNCLAYEKCQEFKLKEHFEKLYSNNVYPTSKANQELKALIKSL